MSGCTQVSPWLESIDVLGSTSTRREKHEPNAGTLLCGRVGSRGGLFGGWDCEGAEDFDGRVAGGSVEGDDRGAGTRCSLPDSESGWDGDEHELEMRGRLLEGWVADCDFDEEWRFVSADFGQDAGLRSTDEAGAVCGEVCAGDGDCV